MKDAYKVSSFFILSVFFFNVSCTDEFKLFNDEVDLFDNYKDVIAVYSNICVYDTLHFIRVQKGFIAYNVDEVDNNPEIIYFNPDSIIVKVYIIKSHLIIDNQFVMADTLKTFYCNDTLLVDEVNDNGSSPIQAFYFESDELTKYGFDNVYLGLEVKKDDKIVNAHTQIVDGLTFVYSPYASSFPLEDNTFNVEIKKPVNAQKILAKMYFQYYEMKNINGDLAPITKTFEVVLDDFVLNDPVRVPENATITNYTDLFYDNLERDILTNGDTINTIFRRLHKVYFTSMVGNHDLALVSNLPTFEGTTFNDNQNYYTNINGGLGFFSCYGTSETKKFYYSIQTVNKVLELYGQKYLFRGE